MENSKNIKSKITNENCADTNNIFLDEKIKSKESSLNSIESNQSLKEDISNDDFDNEQGDVATATNVKKKQPKTLIEIIFWVILILGTICTFFIVQFELRYDTYIVEGTSMQPTLNSYGYYKGDTLYVNKFATPKRGEIGVFQSEGILDKNGKKINLVKRVIAIEGDELDIVKVDSSEQNNSGVVTLKTTYELRLKKANESTYTVLQENYVQEKYPGDPVLPNEVKYTQLRKYKEKHGIALDTPIIVPKDNFFVMGDNREHSGDSATVGTMSIVFGRVDFILKYDPIKNTQKNFWKSFMFKFILKF